MTREIKIAARYRPYSLVMGELCFLPSSAYALQVYPTYLRILDVKNGAMKIAAEIKMKIEGPLKNFTIMADLEKPSILVWGMSSRGFIRYSLKPTMGNGVCLTLEKAPGDALEMTYQEHEKNSVSMKLQKSESSIFLASETDDERPQTGKERLSLGGHKAQDWSMIQRRKDLCEILPLWYAASQNLPLLKPLSQDAQNAGVFSLMENCRDILRCRQHDQLYSSFLKLFLAGFQGMLVPQLEDQCYQGLALPPLNRELSPLYFFSESRGLIRSLFLEENKYSLNILPHLPPEFHCGRFLNLKCEALGTLDIEWTKKEVRRAFLRVEEEAEISIHFPHALKECRVRRGGTDRGSVLMNGEKMALAVGDTVWLDNFKG